MSWQDKCRADGGRVTVVPDGANKGEPCCAFLRNKGTRSEHWEYDTSYESLLEKMRRVTGIVGEKQDTALGALVQARDDVKQAVIDNTAGAVPGVVGHLLGVPPWLVLAVAGYVGWRFLNHKLKS
jgi:hypothetical protein